MLRTDRINLNYITTIFIFHIISEMRPVFDAMLIAYIVCFFNNIG